MKIQDRKFSDNPYYSPEKCGLEIIDTLDADLSWEFDTVVVWKDIESGQLFWDRDSGCSCPTEFEQVDRLSDLTELNEESFFNFKEACEHLETDKSETDKFLARFKQLI